MGFWDDVKKDFQRCLKERVHLLKEKAIVMKEKAEELTEEGKKRYKIFDNQMTTQKEVGKLGGRIYDQSSKSGNPLLDKKVKTLIARIKKLEAQIKFTNHKNGLVFGFADNPAGIIRSHYDKMRKTIYIFDELYEKGLTNDLLADRVKIMLGTERIVCDSAEPKSIAELQKLGVSAASASKGKDSVVHGIQWLQQRTIVVDKKGINTQNELQTYKWKEDAGGFVVRSGGLPVPLDRDNHLIDALRYAFEDEMEGTWLIS